MLQKLLALPLLIGLTPLATVVGQQLPRWVESVRVTRPTPGGIGAVTLSGDWLDTCAPDAVSHTRTGSTIDLEVTHAGLGDIACGDAITPWTLTEEFGPLPPGEFRIRGTLVAVDPTNRSIRERVSGPDLLFTSFTIPQGRFQGLGNPPNDAYVSRAFDVSADGRVVAGHTELAPGAAGFITHEAFAWSPETGMFPLGILPGGIPGGSTARGVSADGNVVVGGSSASFGPEAFRWTLGGGMQGLGGLIETSQSTAAATSRDGSVVVGDNEFFPPMHSDPTLPGVQREAFRWTRDSGMVGLGQVNPGGTSWATDVSAGGDVVVGNATPNPFIEIAYPDISEPFRWTRETGMVGLGHFPDFFLGAPIPLQRETTAEAVSADGTYIVGGGRVFNGLTGEILASGAYRWTREDGYEDLGDLPPCIVCLDPLTPDDPNRNPADLLPAGPLELKAVDVSADGAKIIGVGSYHDLVPFPTDDPDGTIPPNFFPVPGREFSFLWEEGRGMRLLEDVLLNEYGFGQTGQLDGWQLGAASAISDDGTTIVGTGINPQGQQEAWRVVLGRTTVPGDADFDGDVDRDDAAILRGNLGMADSPEFTDGDFDFNGRVDGDDLLAMLLRFGRPRATFHPAGQSAAAVPEPATFVLLCLLLIGGNGTRRRA